MFIAGKFDKKPSSTIYISFVRNTHRKMKYLEAVGVIAWGDEEGIGIKFHSMDFDCYLTLVEPWFITLREQSFPIFSNPLFLR